MEWKRRLRTSYLFASCAFTVSIFFGYHLLKTRPVSIIKRFDMPMENSLLLDPQDLLDCLTNGRWEPNVSASKQESVFMDKFIREHRNLLGLPNPLQRNDNLCGNISFTKPLGWYRAVCDPHQSTPCCYEGTCRDLTREQCRCDECYDLRQDLHAELSTWTNNDNRCKVRVLDRYETCKALDVTEMLLVGDSHMRHMYMALQTMVGEDDVNVYTVDHASKEIKAMCRGIMRYRRECRGYTRSIIQGCGGKLTVTLKELETTKASAAILRRAGSMLNKPGSLFVISIGHHESFNYEKIVSNITGPLLDMIEKSDNVWPKVIWVGGHSMGTMKTPNVVTQSNPHVIKFNNYLRKYVTERGVTFFDWYNLTKKIHSAEGSHFYKGANELKARVLLNYLIGAGSVKNLPDFKSKREQSFNG